MGNSNKSNLRKAQSVPDTQRLPPDAPVFNKVSKSHSHQRLNQSLGKASGGKSAKLLKGQSKQHVEDGVPQLAPAEAAFLPDFPLRGDLEDLDFEVIDVIAKGAYGNVIKVQREDSKRFYAMKVLDKKQIIEEGAIRQCKDEAAIQSMAGDHPLVVKAHEYWQSHHNLYIVLDYIPHGDMFTLWTFHGAFPEALVKLYIAEMALVIDYLHNSSVIYRDVKMENILFDQRGHIQLTDFGLAKWLQGGEQTRTVCGTLQYMAPEVLSVYPYSHSADWWSIGILMFAMLAGRYPVDGADTHTRMAQRVFECDYFLPGNISDAAQDVINRVLTKSPHKRLGDIDSLQDLEFFDDVFFQDLIDRKVNPIDAVSPDFFPMTGESWAPHLLTEEEQRHFDHFDGINNNVDHGYKKQQSVDRHNYSKRHHHHPSTQRIHHPDPPQLLRQKSVPEHVGYSRDSYSSSLSGNLNYRDEQSLYKDRRPSDSHNVSENEDSSRRQSQYPSAHRGHDHSSSSAYVTTNENPLNQPASLRQQYQRHFQNAKPSVVNQSRETTFDAEPIRRLSQDIVSNSGSLRSKDFESGMSGFIAQADTQSTSSSHPPSINSLERTTFQHPRLAGSGYKQVEAPPTITVPGPQWQPTPRQRIQPNPSNQVFGYLGPGPPFNVSNDSNSSTGSSANTLSRNNDNVGRSGQANSMAPPTSPYSQTSRPAGEFKTLEAPPTVTLSFPPASATRPNNEPITNNAHGQYSSSLSPRNTNTSYQGHTSLDQPPNVMPRQNKVPPPVPAKPVVPAKPQQTQIRPQPAPRRSLRGRKSQGPGSSSSNRSTFQVPSSSSSSAQTSHVTAPSGYGIMASNGGQVNSFDQVNSSHISYHRDLGVSPGLADQTRPPQPLRRTLPPSQGEANLFNAQDPQTYESRSGLSSPPYGYNNSSTHNQAGKSDMPIRSPSSEASFRWNLPANVAPSFV